MNKLFSSKPLLTALMSLAIFLSYPATLLQAESVKQELPAKGMLYTDVQAKFGAANKVHQTVGNPPITRWEYQGFSVIFENNHVVHTVLHGTVPGTKAPMKAGAQLPPKASEKAKKSMKAEEVTIVDSKSKAVPVASNPELEDQVPD